MFSGYLKGPNSTITLVFNEEIDTESFFVEMSNYEYTSWSEDHKTAYIHLTGIQDKEYYGGSLQFKDLANNSSFTDIGYSADFSITTLLDNATDHIETERNYYDLQGRPVPESSLNNGTYIIIEYKNGKTSKRLFHKEK